MMPFPTLAVSYSFLYEMMDPFYGYTEKANVMFFRFTQRIEEKDLDNDDEDCTALSIAGPGPAANAKLGVPWNHIRSSVCVPCQSLVHGWASTTGVGVGARRLAIFVGCRVCRWAGARDLPPQRDRPNHACLGLRSPRRRAMCCCSVCAP